MNRNKTWLSATVCAAALVTAASAGATVITMDAREYDAGVIPGTGTSADYVAAWPGGAPNASYLDQTLLAWTGNSNSIAGGANQKLAYHDTVAFTLSGAQAGTYNFRFGVDFGYGGTLLVDGVAQTTNTGNMWWGGNFNNSSGVLSTTISLGAGAHTIELYGYEDCCDGASAGQWSKGNGAYQYFTSSSFVPEPAAWALMLAGFGLGGAALRTRRRAIAAV